MAREERRPALAAELLGELRRALDVGEQERHGPDRLRRCGRAGGALVSDAAAPSTVRSRAASPRRIASASGGLLEERLLEVPRREGEAARRLGGDDLGDPRQPVEDRQLAEELARPQDRELLAVADDPDRAVDDRKKPVPISPWRAIDAIGREIDLDRPLGDRREVGRPDAEKSRQAPSNSVRRSCVSVNAILQCVDEV